jgi:hypothetical protein
MPESTVHMYNSETEATAYAAGAGFKIKFDRKGHAFASREDMERDFILWVHYGTDGRCYWRRTTPREVTSDA